MLQRLSRKGRWHTYEGESVSSIYIEVLSPKRRNDNLILYYLSDVWKQTTSIPFMFEHWLCGLKCVCEDRSLVRLDTCYLRTGALDPVLKTARTILDVISPDDPRWKYLQPLGVSLQPDLELFLQFIRQKKSEAMEGQEVFTDTVDTLYKDLVMFCRQNSNSDIHITLR